MRTSGRVNRALAVEAAALGLGYTSVLCWASTCLVATFGGVPLANPYWPDIPWLRTDTTGIIAFALAAASLVVSKYLRLLRFRNGVAARQLPERASTGTSRLNRAGRSGDGQGERQILGHDRIRHV